MSHREKNLTIGWAHGDNSMIFGMKYMEVKLVPTCVGITLKGVKVFSH